MDQAKKSYEVEIYVPQADNHGQAYPSEMLTKFKESLTQAFGGVTDTKHKNEGVWKVHGLEYRDEIVIWRVFTSEHEKLSTLGDFRRRMEKELKQKQILVLMREVFIL